jgi:hypothetical protein
MKIKNEIVKVKMKVDQRAPLFGDKEKGDVFELDYHDAKLLEDRGILEIIKKKGKYDDK